MPVIIGAGITAAAAAAATIISNTITNLMQQPVRKQQIASMQLQDRIKQLDSQQQYVLALKLQQAQTDNERMTLLTDAVTQIDVATVGGNATIIAASVNKQATSSLTTAIIIGGSVVALIAAIYFLNKND